MGSTFYSLEAENGGAIYVSTDFSIKNCRFANNTAENHEGNDVYIYSDTAYYNDSSNVQNTCSLSVGPGQIKTYIGVFYLCFISFCFVLLFFIFLSFLLLYYFILYFVFFIVYSVC
jgi:hypothetical protein